MKRKHILIAAVSLILALALAIGVVGCSSQEEISPAYGKDTAADDYFDFTDTIVEVEITDEDGNTVTTVISGEPAEPTEGSSDTSAEAGSASNGTNLPTVTSTQTTKPATTTSHSGNSPAVTTRPSTSPSTTTAPVVTTAPAPAVTTAPKPSVTTSPEPVVTTTPVVTTEPPVTTTPAPVPGHTHSYSSKVTKEPTCTATGTRTYTCSCGDKYTESIPAKGHNWKTETIHHDAVIGTRNVTETWVRIKYVYWIRLTQAGMDAGYSSPENPLYYKVIAAIGFGKLGDNGKVVQDTIIWEYLYKDTIEDSIAYCVTEIAVDLLKKGYSDGTYNNTYEYEYEEKVVGTETYVITPAYDETVTTCTVCGAHK